MRFSATACSAILPLVVLFMVNAGRASDEISFTEQIAPLFRNHCIRCHGEADAQGDFSLTSAGALAASGHVIEGNPDESFLLEVVSKVDDEPPAMPKEGAPLSVSEVELLRRWIAEGAKWPRRMTLHETSKADASWWSLRPIGKISVPAAAHATGAYPVANPIDRFVQARLAEKGLKPSPQADRRTLIRRLYFDLLGLPPSPQQVAEFLADDQPLAYERLVDRLLGSPHYGERWARHWLDIAHYADTHGFERDKRRDNAFRYRDYVIRSFNEDKPYNQFLLEQIAGDVAAPHDLDAVVATGFLAAGPWDYVGQVETKSPMLRRAARADDLDDMVTQVITSTVALTVNCARCHDHKLDPIPQEDYYRLWSVFAGVKRADREIDSSASQSYNQQKQRLAERLRDIRDAIGPLARRAVDLADIVGNGNGFGTGTKGHGLDPRTGQSVARSFGFLDNIKANDFRRTQHKMIDGVFIPDGGVADGVVTISSTGMVVRDIADTSAQAWDAIRHGPVASQDITMLAGVDYTSAGHRLLGLHANAGVTFDLAAIRKATGYRQMRLSAVAGYGGKSPAGKADFAIYLDGSRAFHQAGVNPKSGGIPIRVELPETVRFLTFVSTDGGNGIGYDQIFLGDPQLQPEGRSKTTDTDIAKLAELRSDEARLVDELSILGPAPRIFGIVSETPPTVHVLARGNPEMPGAVVAPGALRALRSLEPDFGDARMPEGQRRLALAHWIIDPRNPLTRRVIVNRLWHHHFGRGLVDTPSDFGYGGGRPSHPRLLDWLANELLRADWSLKHIHRLLVTSATYRQISGDANMHSQLGLKPPNSVDSDNRLLWRMNMRRLDAESLRDAVLATCGTLDAEQFGPGFEDFEYQEEYAPIYTYVTADRPALWRRSIYRFVVRSTPNRFMTTLDCPNPANLTPKRVETTTALQSLALMNNAFMLRQAAHFARRLEIECGDRVDAQVERAFQIGFARAPAMIERRAAVSLVEQQGLHALCRMLLNANEFVYID